MSAICLQPGAYGRDTRCRRRDTMPEFGGNTYAHHYDQLFDFIKGNEDVAKSINRFIPWVNSSEDVIALLDTYLMQNLAKNYLRYHYYWSNEPAMVVTPATILGDRQFTKDWMEWLFAKTFVYPLPASGLQELMVTGNDRQGVGYIGSYSYGCGEIAWPQGVAVEEYVETGGDPKYDLRDPKRYPKTAASTYFTLDSRMAGLYWPRVGDVAGPEKSYAQWFNTLENPSRVGWKWTKDPRFAFVLKQYFARKDETDAEWKAIEGASATVKRAPWLDNRSRFLPNWFGLLESGVEQDDFRFRRNVYLRIGQGWGHQHGDTLDLQFHAHGYPMTIDGGQRGGYSSPGDSTTRVHNLVEVDEAGWMGHSWLTALTDTPGARYMSAEAEPPANHTDVNLYRRQVALVDVDEGQGSKPLTPQQCGPGGKLNPSVVTPNSYIFDVVRVSGGKVHTYCFHGPVEDEMVANWANKQPMNLVPEPDKTYLSRFPIQATSFAGDAPDVAEATWRMIRGQGWGNEQAMAGVIWNEASPRKFTRLSVFDAKGARMLSAQLDCRYGKYQFTNMYVQKRNDAQADAVFPALIEPYVGDPFIASKRLLPIAGNEEDARKAVAVEVTTKNGHTDICFADGRPDKTREVAGLKIAGEFAFYGKDDEGLRQATLSGGTLLAAPGVTLQVAVRERTGKVVKSNYLEKTITLDQAWPVGMNGRTFEIGLPHHMTTYTVQGVKTAGTQSEIKLSGGGDFYLSYVVDAEPEKGIIYGHAGFSLSDGAPCPGIDKGWVASNDTMTRFWRAEYLGGSREQQRYGFKLTGAPLSQTDFKPGDFFRLWEYGVGDSVRQSTYTSVRRVARGVFELVADADVIVSLRGAGLESSADQAAWRPVAAKVTDGSVEAKFATKDMPDGRMYLKLK
jgi:hypothetical protein